MQVSFQGVGHRFHGGSWLFRGLDVSLMDGRSYSLTGPSGAGKSTLLALLAGWMAPAEGRIVRPDSITVGWVFQNPHGSPNRSARDHVALPYLAKGSSASLADHRADEVLAAFGLLEVADRPFRSLSGGEAQRLMLARAVATGPGLLLIDEPTAQLDRRTAAAVNASISSLVSDGTIVVVATHDPGTRDACTDHLELESRGSDFSSHGSVT